MQRSRRALLQRRALEKAISGRSRFYMVSLSLVFVLWAVVILCSLWISRGDGFRRDDTVTPPVGISTREEKKLWCEEPANSMGETLLKDTCPAHSDDTSCTNSVEDGGAKKESVNADRNADRVFSPQQPESGSDSIVKPENSVPKSDLLSRSVPLSLEEFKSRAFSSKSKSVPGQAGGVIHRVEPGGQEYNYASSSKGAKVLAFNKEAKGANNILSRDKDKYLRNPCSAEEKFVVIELSEETLVDTIEMANFEHYSSNLKDFELLGSLVYPADEWVKLGNFTAMNVKHAQRFALHEPKWVRYLKLNLLSHYGSEFYCTLSVLEAYGVDAVERMLEDLISVQDNLFVVEESSGDQKSLSSQPESSQGDDLYQLYKEMESESSSENLNVKHEVLKPKVPDRVDEIRHQVGRMPGDTALKILMQKVRSLDLSLSVLERYMEEVNSRYGNIFQELDDDLGEKHASIEKIRSDLKNLIDSQEAIVKDVGDVVSWKSLVSLQLDSLARDYLVLSSSVARVQENQIYVEKKSTVVFLICLIFGFLAFLGLLVDILVSVCAAAFSSEITQSRKFCCRSSSWFFLLSSCSLIVLILAS